MTLTELLYGILFQPVPVLQYLSKEKPLGKGLFIFITVMIFNLIINRGINLLEPGQEMFTIPDNLFCLYGITGIFFSIFMLFIIAGLLSLLSEFIYHRGNGSGLFVSFCFAGVPGVLGPPLQYASLLLGVEYLGVILAVLILIWVIILNVLSIREALELTTGEAVFLFILPLVFMLLIGAGIAFTVISMVPFHP